MTSIPSRPELAAADDGMAARYFDAGVVFLAGLLMALGVAMVYSASSGADSPPFQWRQIWNTPLRQGVFALLGFAAMLVMAHVDYHVLAWRRPRDGWRAGVLLILAALLLVAVLLPGVGKQMLGARRAIYLPGIGLGFQPSEIAKVVLVIWLAALLTRAHASRFPRGFPVVPDRPRPKAPGRDVRAGQPPAAAAASSPGDRGGSSDSIRVVTDLRAGYLPAVATGGLLVGLTGLEDFGTAALMGVVMVVLLMAAGARRSHLVLTGLVGALAGAALVITKPHRVGRIVTWFSEDADPLGAGYQVNQALLAIGSGGWFGRGLGQGVQKFGYLPQDNNDFIFAIVCEELGIVGGIVVVALFLALLWRGWNVARRAPDRFGQLVALGITLTICLQAAFNVGVVTNSVPTKGISLPFVSAGGSGVVFLGLAAGLLASIGRTSGVPPDARA